MERSRADCKRVALVPHEDIAVVHCARSRPVVSQPSDHRRVAGGFLSPERHRRALGPLQLCGLRGQSAATPTFPEIEALVLAGVSGPRREPRAFEGDLTILDVVACFGLVEGLEQLSSLPKLQTVNVCDTALAQAVFVERRRRALDAEVRAEGGALMVGGCCVGRCNVTDES